MNLLISYSNLDSTLAKMLKKSLEKFNFNVWLYEHQMDFGDNIQSRLRNEIIKSDFVLVVITPNSLKSNWVDWEIKLVLELEQAENNIKILPILMKGEFIPFQLKDRVFADFRTAGLMSINFSKLIRQLLKAVPEFGSYLPESLKIDMKKINKEFFSGPKTAIIKSPMIGTFYRAPYPGKRPFVEVGDKIKTGEVVCIIEAMKLFNEIESEVEGKIVEILANDEQPLEYDQPLMLIELETQQ